MDLAALTRLMDLLRQVAAHAAALYDTEEVQRGMQLMETADVLASRSGCTIDEVVQLHGGVGSHRS
jgi:hypothetical protein